MGEFESIIIGIKRGFEAFKKWAETIDWEAVHATFKYISEQLPSDIEEASIVLMNLGWFIWFLEGDMNDFTDKFKYLINATNEKQDEYMKEYVRQRIEYIESELCVAYPNRFEQVKQAIAAHKAQLYYSSVPALLALAEGIGRENYPKVGIFAKHRPNSPKKGQPISSDIFDHISGIEIVEEAVLKPLKVSSSVTKTITEPSQSDMESFNRHLIMHGLSDSFGSEQNSLKVISLVFFIHASLNFLKSKETHNKLLLRDGLKAAP